MFQWSRFEWDFPPIRSEGDWRLQFLRWVLNGIVSGALNCVFDILSPIIYSAMNGSGFILHLTSRHQLPARLAKRAMTGSGRTFSSFAPMDRVIDVWMTSEATFYYLVWVIQCFFPSLIHRFSVSRSRPGFEISNRMVICCVPVTVSDLSDCSQPLCAHAKQKARARSGRWVRMSGLGVEFACEASKKPLPSKALRFSLESSSSSLVILSDRIHLGKYGGRWTF